MRRHCLSMMMASVLVAAPAIAAPPARPVIAPMASWKAPVPVEKVAEGGLRVVVLERHDVPLVRIVVTVRA